MTFTTLTFVLFLALVFSLYWGLRSRRSRNVLLLVASYAFYGWWDVRFCGLIFASSLLDYGVGLALRDHDPRGRRSLVTLSVVANLGLLGLFKYFNFFAENLALVADSVGWRMDPIVLRVALPVGISFYTFQTLSYVIDVYRRKLEPTHSLVDYLAYVSFFPQLVAGPIERGTRLLPQFQRPRTFDAAKASDGCRQILWGFFKKLVLADNLASIVDPCFASGSCGGPRMAIAVVCFAFQIYWDFSAYSDIAIGTARLFGIDLMRNFAYPYFSRSIGEFWRRWHISLSTWFRDYLYIPLGGSRRGPARTVVNVLATFTISGLWHGASWTFVVWGAVHGAAVAPTVLRRGRVRRGPDEVPGGDALIPRLPVALAMLATFLFACATWVFFRAPSLSAALGIFGRMVSRMTSRAAWADLALHGDQIGAFLPLVGIVVAIEWIQRRHPHPLVLDGWPRAARWTLYTTLIWLSFLLMPRATGQFIYFQF